ncbi:hypothetical protein Tco_0770071 [Tanacetum coccineum]|uniref:Uncharacterized protein n=1 Tax=Tanacetum coccineum TaxID=301880 RepID=A0ABQ4ZBF5_9ASTR
MKEAVDVAIELKSNNIREEAQAENHAFLNSLDSNMPKITKDQVKTQTSKIKSKVEKYVTKSLGEAEVTRDDKDKDDEPSTGLNRGTKRWRSERKLSDDDVIPDREVYDAHQWHPPTSPTPDRECTQSSFDEFLATPIDFSAFMIIRLKIYHLTQELLTDPTYDLMKGTCKSVAELDYHLEEAFKATNEQLDWNNPEGTSHLEEIMVHRQDDVLYKFREGYFKRLSSSHLKIMLLLLVQGQSYQSQSGIERYAIMWL